MVSENQIIQKLKVIDQCSFELMVGNLLHQGAFPEIVSGNASIELFGVNIEKKRTIRSSPRSDAELVLEKVVVENSVQENWQTKLREAIEKNRQKEIKKFAFFTNQDVGTKQIRVNKQNIDAEKHYCSILNCQSCFIFGQKALVLRLQNPRFFYVRRNFLNIPQDFFYSIHEYENLLEKNDSLKCEVDGSKIEKYGSILANMVTFDPNQILLLHNDDYITLLHTVKAWGSRRFITSNSRNPINIDLCFIKWPHRVVNFEDVSDAEINDDIRTIIFVWGAHEIDNLSEYLMFNKRNTMLIFVCKSAFKEDVYKGLEDSGFHMSLRELHILEIDQRKITPDERELHGQKIATIAENLTNLLLRYEALIYFYSPSYLDDRETKNKIRNLLKINETEANQLDNLLLSNDLASITGRIFWLKQPVVAKDLLNEYINQNIFSIDYLMA